MKKFQTIQEIVAPYERELLEKHTLDWKALKIPIQKAKNIKHIFNDQGYCIYFTMNKVEMFIVYRPGLPETTLFAQKDDTLVLIYKDKEILPTLDDYFFWFLH